MAQKKRNTVVKSKFLRLKDQLEKLTETLYKVEKELEKLPVSDFEYIQKEIDNCKRLLNKVS